MDSTVCKRAKQYGLCPPVASLLCILLLVVSGTLGDGLPLIGRRPFLGGFDDDALDDSLVRHRLGPGLGMRRILGPSKRLDDDDDDDSDIILSTNVVATSSVGGLAGPPGLVTGANLLSTGPGAVSASMGGTYDFLGGLDMGSGVYGLLPGPDLGLGLNLGFGRRPTSTFLSRRSGLGRGLGGFKLPPLGPKLTYVSPKTRNPFFGPPKRRSRPRYKPFGRRRRNFWWKGRSPRMFGRKCLKWRKKFPFFG